MKVIPSAAEIRSRRSRNLYRSGIRRFTERFAAFFAVLFAALTAGKADAACTNISVVGAMLNGSYNDCALVKKIPSGEDYGLVVAKTNPALTEQINGALEELTNDGTLDALLEKWELNL